MSLVKNVSFFYPDRCRVRLGYTTGESGAFYRENKMVGFKLKKLKVNANMSSSRGVETINGKKVNGNHVIDKPYLGREKEKEESTDSYLLWRFIEDGLVFRQSFIIRSYEIGPDKTATMESIMNLLQETALNHVSNSGVAGNGFGATREMSLRKLIWVVTRIHIQVEKYSSWGDVVEIDTWVDAAGKNGMRRDWVIRDYNTQQIICRATSTWVIMNRETRRISKIPTEVKNELKPFYTNKMALATEDIDTDKIEKLTDETALRIKSGLEPRWSDMDANQHVNNVKYIGWLLESVPINVLQDYDLTSMTLEYRRECRLDNVLESLTHIKAINNQGKPSKDDDDENNNNIKEDFECTHLLRMQDGNAEIVRARSIWQCKQEDGVTKW